MYIVLLARYKSLNLLVLLPKLYVMSVLGVIFPATTNPARVPVLVIFGCAFVVNVPVNKLADTLPFDIITLLLAISTLPFAYFNKAEPVNTPLTLY